MLEKQINLHNIENIKIFTNDRQYDFSCLLF